MCLATVREPAITNRLLSVVRDARFAEHHTQRGRVVLKFKNRIHYEEKAK